MATHSSTLVWKSPWTEEPDGIQSTVTKSRTRLSQLCLFFTHLVENKYQPGVRARGFLLSVSLRASSFSPAALQWGLLEEQSADTVLSEDRRVVGTGA